MIVERTNYYYDIDKLKNDALRLSTYFNEIHQLSIKYDPTKISDTLPHLSCISKTPTDILNWNFTETSPIFENSDILNAVSQVKEKTKRMRLMAMKPRSCYSLHTDAFKRLHWAIITHPSCHLNFQEDIDKSKFYGYHIPADGYAYMIDTTHFHTAVNPWDQFRYHLVIDIIE